MTLDQFIEKYNGKYVDYDGRYGPQCVDLMRQYVKEVLGLDQYKSIPAGPNAKTIFKNFKNNGFFKKVLNTPTGVPKKGDIVFWGTYPFVTGWHGHVAIFVGGNVWKFISFDQNYPKGSFCRYFNHSYKGVMGWLTPKK